MRETSVRVTLGGFGGTALVVAAYFIRHAV